ncbi:signal peptidase I SipW [Neobacillus niacini]|uniref:signal peptidase I SipW n=1 Tax=Neobacillus niacini TaxID=86668 RepID=UPI0021CB33D5|nr:signal peptidase I [Neobacillus niacini]MCM3767930.1 signal peptidase I [Neobacillus niacini]
MKIVLKIVSGFITTLLVLLLLISLYIMISSRITGGQPSIMGNQLMLVLSGSMEPKIETGSVVGIKPVEDKTNLKVGDIITFYSPLHKDNRIITHRIVEIKGSGEFTEFITKGDNNQANDPMPIPLEKVIGKFSGIQIPYAGYILEFLQSKKGIAVSLIFPGLLLIIYNSFVLWKIFRSWDPSQKAANNQSA